MINKKLLRNTAVYMMAAALVAAPLMSTNTRLFVQASGSATTTTQNPGGGTSGNETPEESSGSSGSSKSSSSSSSSGSAAAAVTAGKAVTTADGKVLTSTVKGTFNTKAVEGVVVTTPASIMNSVLKVEAGESAFLKLTDSNCGEKAKASVNAAAKAIGGEVGPMLDINIGKLGKQGKFTNVSEVKSFVNFVVTPPKNFVVKPGNEMAVICVQPGGKTTILPNWSSDTKSVSFFTKGFGVFAFTQAPKGSFDAYKVSQYQEAN